MSLFFQHQQYITNLSIVPVLPLVEIDNNNLLDNSAKKIVEELPKNIYESKTLWNDSFDDISDKFTYMLAKKLYNNLVDIYIYIYIYRER